MNREFLAPEIVSVVLPAEQQKEGAARQDVSERTTADIVAISARNRGSVKHHLHQAQNSSMMERSADWADKQNMPISPPASPSRRQPTLASGCLLMLVNARQDSWSYRPIMRNVRSGMSGSGMSGSGLGL